MGGMSTDWDYSGSYNWSDDDKTRKKSARDYAKNDNRTYTGNRTQGLEPPVGKEIKTDSPLAQILVVDVTGSMRAWPQLIFEKIPTLYAESNAVLQKADLDDLKNGKTVKDILDMAVIAVGDAKGDAYPIQVVDFSKGTDLVNGINTIYPEGHGGSNKVESYDLAAYFITRHCQTPNVPKGAKPLVIIAGDEGFYDHVQKAWVRKLIGDDLTSNLDAKVVMEELREKCDTYIIRPEIAYPVDVYAKIQTQWEEVFGAERVLRMTDPNRLVDCIIGIAGYAADNFDQGVKILERRQTPKQVKDVLETLHPLLKK